MAVSVLFFALSNRFENTNTWDILLLILCKVFHFNKGLLQNVCQLQVCLLRLELLCLGVKIYLFVNENINSMKLNGSFAGIFRINLLEAHWATQNYNIISLQFKNIFGFKDLNIIRYQTWHTFITFCLNTSFSLDLCFCEMTVSKTG